MEPQYYVIDGANKYGPATVSVLNQWAGEGRITPQTMVQETTSDTPISIQQVPGIQLPSAPIPPQQQMPPQQQPPLNQPMGHPSQEAPYAQAPSPYYRPMGTGMPGPDPALKSRATTALVFGIVALIFGCCIGGIIAIVNASQAQTAVTQGDNMKAEQLIKRANTWSIVSIVIGVIFFILRIALVANGQLH